MSLEEHAHLWEGTEPGWTLQYVENVVWNVTFPFAADGATIQEVSKLRELLDEFRDLAVSDVWKRLRGQASYRMQNSLTNLEMRSLIEKAERLGLAYAVESIDRSGYLPVHADGTAVLIEENHVSDEVVRRMLAAGVPVQRVHVD